jgi:uncharacterized membrane-anchored protein
MTVRVSANKNVTSKGRLIIALLIPIMFLLAHTLHKHYQSVSGTVVTLPIEGFDPRDLLSGHYLQYQVVYETVNSCYDIEDRANVFQRVALCLEPKRKLYVSRDLPESCSLYLRGQCQSGRFKAGIEHFFIPDDHAAELDTKVRNKSGSIRVSVNANGEALVKELLIDGKPWLQTVTP